MLDLFGFYLRHGDGQHSVLVMGAGLDGIDRPGQAWRSIKRATVALPEQVTALVPFMGLLGPTLDSQHRVLDGSLDVVRIEARERCVNQLVRYQAILTPVESLAP